MPPATSLLHPLLLHTTATNAKFQQNPVQSVQFPDHHANGNWAYPASAPYPIGSKTMPIRLPHLSLAGGALVHRTFKLMPMRPPSPSLSVSNPCLSDLRTLAYRFQTHANLTSVTYPIKLWSSRLPDFQPKANATSVP